MSYGFVLVCVMKADSRIWLMNLRHLLKPLFPLLLIFPSLASNTWQGIMDTDDGFNSSQAAKIKDNLQKLEERHKAREAKHFIGSPSNRSSPQCKGEAVDQIQSFSMSSNSVNTILAISVHLSFSVFVMTIQDVQCFSKA